MTKLSLQQLATSRNGFRGHVLGLDPGETTGWAHFYDYKLVECGQLNTKTVPYAYASLQPLFQGIVSKADGTPIEVAIEDYRIYSWKSDDHKWAAVHTVKVVGLCELLCALYQLTHNLRMAQNAKKFVTDEKLKAWGIYVTGQKHARDAIRHAVFHIVSGDKHNAIQPLN